MEIICEAIYLHSLGWINILIELMASIIVESISGKKISGSQTERKIERVLYSQYQLSTLVVKI